MSGSTLASFEWLLFLLIALGLGVWELVSVRRSISRDQAARHRAARDEADGG